MGREAGAGLGVGLSRRECSVHEWTGQSDLWGGPPGPQPAPRPASRNSLKYFGRRVRADEGVGRLASFNTDHLFRGYYTNRQLIPADRGSKACGRSSLPEGSGSQRGGDGLSVTALGVLPERGSFPLSAQHATVPAKVPQEPFAFHPTTLIRLQQVPEWHRGAKHARILPVCVQE